MSRLPYLAYVVGSIVRIHPKANSIDRPAVRIQQANSTSTTEDMGASQSKPDGDKVFYNETPIQVR